MNEVWDEEASEGEIFDRNWTRLQDIHGVIGYREGLVQGQAQFLQQGFDDGYKLGAGIGLELGKKQGILAAMESAEAKLLLKEIENLQWDDLFKEYFKSGVVLMVDDINRRFDEIVKLQ
jgi:hypothetical protein